MSQCRSSVMKTTHRSLQQAMALKRIVADLLDLRCDEAVFHEKLERIRKERRREERLTNTPGTAAPRESAL